MSEDFILFVQWHQCIVFLYTQGRISSDIYRYLNGVHIKGYNHIINCKKIDKGLKYYQKERKRKRKKFKK